MIFENIVVKIDYRFDAGDSLPSCKALMARVVQQSADGYIYGDNLIRIYTTSVLVAQEQCVRKLKGKTETITFVYGKLLEEKNVLRRIA